jgi:hypothetical protein
MDRRRVVTVEAEGSDDAAGWAITQGWAVPRGLAAAGLSLLNGATLVDPEHGTALLLAGDAASAGKLILGLAGGGWRLLADRPAPLQWTGEVAIAHPRAAPLLVSESEADGWPSRRVRPDSTAFAVEVPRATTPTALRAIAYLSPTGPHGPLTGHRRFEQAARVLIGGVLAAAPDAFTEHARLAGLPAIVVDGRSGGAQDAVSAWWRSLDA